MPHRSKTYLGQLERLAQEIVGNNSHSGPSALAHGLWRDLYIYPRTAAIIEAGREAFADVLRGTCGADGANFAALTKFGNAIVVHELRIQKYRRGVRGEARNICLTCSDSRLDFLPVWGADVVARHRIVATPGGMPSQDHVWKGIEDPEDVAATLAQNGDWRRQLFEDFDYWCGSDLSLASANTPLVVNVISHKDSHDSHEGCGAFNSNDQHAQKNALFNALALQEWIMQCRGRKCLEKVVLNMLVFDTHNGLPSVEAHQLESSPEGRAAKKLLAKVNSEPTAWCARRLHEPQNPHYLDLAYHAEIGFRVSAFPQAHVSPGVGLFNVALRPNATRMFHDILRLLPILQKCHLKKNPEGTVIVHLDCPRGDRLMHVELYRLMMLLRSDPRVLAILGKAQLKFYTTETDMDTAETEEFILAPMRDKSKVSSVRPSSLRVSNS